MLDLGSCQRGTEGEPVELPQGRSEKLEDREGNRGSFSPEEGARGPGEQAVFYTDEQQR